MRAYPSSPPQGWRIVAEPILQRVFEGMQILTFVITWPFVLLLWLTQNYVRGREIQGGKSIIVGICILIILLWEIMYQIFGIPLWGLEVFASQLWMVLALIIVYMCMGIGWYLYKETDDDIEEE